ncbi:MAG: YlxR family protein [Deltaproteobacteria bacterium]|nr:YlxR family protein [Deltaproteobacteria bacterium]
MVGPTRTCAGCRRRRAKATLLRFVADGRAQLVLDVQQRASVRGVYVCPRATCLDGALRRGSFARSLRRRVTVDQALFDLVAHELEQRVKLLVERALSDGRAEREDDGAIVFVDEKSCRWVKVLQRQLEELGHSPKTVGLEAVGQGGAEQAMASVSHLAGDDVARLGRELESRA